MPPIEFLSEQDFYALLEQPYNPADEFNSEFVAEHYQPHKQMKRALFALGGGTSSGPFSYSAFSAMEDGWTTSRVVAAGLGSESFVRPDLFCQLYAIVTGFGRDYAMQIETDFITVPDFAVFITRHRFVVFMPDRSVLPKVY